MTPLTNMESGNQQGPVKQEPHDEAEIEEMAAKVKEVNRIKMQTLVKPNTPVQTFNIFNFSSPNKDTNEIQASSTSEAEAAKNFGDEESLCRRFGWVELGKIPIPYIIRKGEKYCAVRMLDMKVLNKYLNFLHADVYNYMCIKSYYITEAECQLLNEINFKHCDYQFGRNHFTNRDLIVRCTDALEFYHFLDTCYNKLVHRNINPLDRCGFIRINKESVVPYTVYSEEKHLPLFYFEGEIDTLKLNAVNLEGWDLAYLKFCCKVQAIRNELFCHDSCTVISLSVIKEYFPPDTDFEDYWPVKVLDSRLLINNKAQYQAGQWIRQPAESPVAHTLPPFSPKPATQAKAASNKVHSVQPMYINYALTGGQPSLQPLTANSAVRPSYPSTAATSRQTPPFHTTMAQPSSSSVRSNQQAAAYTRPQTTTNSYMVTGQSTLPQQGYHQGTTQMLRYTDPLMPVRHLNEELRYKTHQNQYRSSEIVDFNTANSATQRTHPINNQQPIYQQPICNQSQEQQSITSGPIIMNNVQHNLIPNAETSTSGTHIPYKVQKSVIESRVIPCINMKPYAYNDLYIAIPDLVEQLFNNVSVQSCQQVMQVLGIELYKGSDSQMRVLYENERCQNMNDNTYFAPVKLVLEYMPQVKYMLGRLISSEAAPQHQ
ncbi:hypothetical protein FQA39_LY00751 [Lamprigera yunnana]|nr:hypothetical protein FQA39_LY00751 [Lamprigera yunnana]